MIPDKKENKIFLIYKEIQSWSVAKSYLKRGFLMYEEMRKYFTIYEERRPLVIYDFATAPFWISSYMRKIWFSFLSVYNVHKCANYVCFIFCSYPCPCFYSAWFLPIKTRSINSLSKYLHNQHHHHYREQASHLRLLTNTSNPWISKPVFLNFNEGLKLVWNMTKSRYLLRNTNVYSCLMN